jgi:hypothetical protein
MSIKDTLLDGPLGFGAAPLGNMFRNIPVHTFKLGRLRAAFCLSGII